MDMVSHSLLEGLECFEVGVIKNPSLYLGEDPFDGIEPGTVRRKFHQDDGLAFEIGPEGLGTVWTPAIQDDVKSVVAVALAEKLEKEDDLPCSLLLEETDKGGSAMDIQCPQEFRLAADLLFCRDLARGSTPGTAAIGLEDHGAFFIKGEHPCLWRSFVQEAFNVFFSP